MTIFQYDLVSEPWIPCLDLQGRRVYRGLLDALLGAHILREVDGETPLVTAALYRLLLAVLHRVYGPPDLATWASLWREGRWQPEPLQAYLDAWRERFDLFHPERPFYQVADQRAIAKQLASFQPHVASGNNPTLFDHQRDEAATLYAPDAAARILVASQAYGIGGLSGIPRVSFTDGPCTQGILFLLEGDNLFETLALNLILYPREMSGMQAHPDDRPAWEMDAPTEPPREVPLGYLDYLTWHNRHILLCPETLDGHVVVKECLAAPALRLADAVKDPLMLWQASRSGGERPLAFRPERALWRDSSALLGSREASSSEALVALEQLRTVGQHLDRGQTLPPEARMAAFGLLKSRAKVELTRTERLPVPRAYLDDPDLVGDLSLALSLAEDVAERLRWATRTLASYLITPALPPDQDRKTADRQRSNDLSNLQNHWASDRSYWSALEVPFLNTLRAIPEDPDAALEAWVDLLRRQARASLHLITQSLAHDPAALKAIVHAERRLNAGLARALDRKEESPTTTVS